MKPIVIAFVLTCANLSAASAADQRPAWAPGEPTQDGVRRVLVRPDTVAPLTFRMKHTTLLILPDSEEILLDDTGDRPSWAIVVNHNIASITPLMAGAETNLNIITKAGTVYSFTLKEGGKGPTDLKVFVTVPEDQAPPVRKFFSVSEYDGAVQGVEALKRQVSDLQDRLREAETKAAEKVPAVPVVAAPVSLHFDYKQVKDEKPFHVKAVFHDGAFSYIQTAATEKFSIYEMKDGRPSLVQFQVEGGLYIVPKVIDEAYLTLGAAKLPIVRKAETGN